MWRKWRDRFVDRYGIGSLVDVLEVLNPAFGLGYPADYPGSTAPTPATREVHESGTHDCSRWHKRPRWTDSGKSS